VLQLMKNESNIVKLMKIGSNKDQINTVQLMKNVIEYCSTDGEWQNITK